MTIAIQTESVGAFRQVIRVDAHTMHADVAAAIGGAGSAPDPHDLFDSSLIACKALTAHVYAKSRGYALDRVEITVDRDTSKERQGTYALRVSIALFGPLSQDEKQKVYDVLVRCPIHKLMTTTTVEIETAPLVPSP